MNQIKNILCIRHPKDEVIAVNVAAICQFNSRFACFKCLKEYNDNEHFMDFKQVISLQQIKFLTEIGETMLGNDNPNIIQLNYYTNTFGNQLIEYQSKLMTELTNRFIKVKTLIKVNMEHINKYQQDVLSLKEIYHQELIKVNQKLTNVTRITQYHQSQQWVELEDQTNTYVNLHYQHKSNDEINTIMNQLMERKQQMYELIPMLQSILFYIGDRQQLITYQNNNNIYQLLPEGKFTNEIIGRIDKTRNIKPKLIFQGTKDGMNAQAFWNKCKNTQSTLIICKSKSGSIFGGYTPCKWIDNSEFQSDPQLSSFLFSVTRQEIYPLKEAKYSILGMSNYGPTFGGQFELNIGNEFQTGYSKLNNIFYSTNGSIIKNNETHLMGGKQPDLVELVVYTFI